MGKYEPLIAMAGMLGLVSFSSLVQKVYETHNTTSLPWIWIIMNLAAQSLALSYGIINLSYGIILPGSLFLSGLSYILYVKLNHKPYEIEKKDKEDKYNV
jgi:hypothetical protein